MDWFAMNLLQPEQDKLVGKRIQLGLKMQSVLDLLEMDCVELMSDLFLDKIDSFAICAVIVKTDPINVDSCCFVQKQL